MAELDVRDSRFETLVSRDAELRVVHSEMGFTEGPVWVPEYPGEAGFLLWSDIPASRLLRWSHDSGVNVFRENTNNTNGNTLDREGRLISCEHSGRRVSRTESWGDIVPLVERYQGRRLNSPNDVAVKSDGTIWFTDPTYGLPRDDNGNRVGKELDANYVFRFDPRSGDLTPVVDDFEMPNGIAFSPDEGTLYVSDTGEPSHIRAFSVSADGTLSNGRVLTVVDPRGPDGFRVDTEGNIWTTAGDGIHVYDRDGTLLGKILCPEQPANCVFGGNDRKTLFITARTSLYAITTDATGAQKP
ncbi:MAG: SMP-30/gluconolactonase/LRE family protein [Chloroflexota bacterium]